MDKRISMAVAAAALTAMPLLAGCGSSTAPQGSSAAPATAPAPATTAPSTTTAAPTQSPSAQASPSTNPADEKKNVQAAAEKFVTAAITIGYPDQKFADYTARLKPLMTASGYDQVAQSTTEGEGDTQLAKLYSQKSRSTPKFTGKPKVNALTADKADVKVSYQSVIQQQTGGSWKTLKTTSNADTVDVSLVHDGGKWLVDGAA